MRLGKVGSVIAVGVLAIIVLVLVGALVYALVRRQRARARRAEAHRVARETPWTAFSRPNLDDGGKTWRVGIERRTEDDSVLPPGPVYVTDEPIDANDQESIWEAEAWAEMRAIKYTEAGAR
jgi:hypothetical protein